MKHLWLIATAALVVGFQSRVWAFEEQDEMDIEAEASVADAQGSELNAGYLNAKAEQKKLDTTLNVSHAEKIVRDSRTQQAYSEALIGKAETEIKSLQRQETNAIARSQKAKQDRVASIEKLKTTIKQLKAYRARVKHAQALAMRDERGVAVVRTRTAKLQGMMPAPRAPATVAQQRVSAKPRRSQASVAQAQVK